MTQITPNFHRMIIWRYETFSESLVKIRCCDITWRHVTSLLKIVIKKCWRQHKISTMGKLFIIFWLHLDNIFPSRGQPTFYDFWFARKCRLSKTADFGSFGSFWIILDHFGPFWSIFEKYTMVPNSVPNIKSLALLSRI